MLTRLRQFFAIPDAERYTDAQYERLVIQAKIRRGDAVWVLPLLAGLAAAGIWAIASWVLTFQILAAPRGGIAPARPITWLLLTGVVAGTVFLAAFFGLRWTMIVRSIRNILNKAGCPFCDFSLVGLKVEISKVRCPECGGDVYLHEHRLNPDDLIPDSHRNAPIAGAGPRGAYTEPTRSAPPGPSPRRSARSR